MSRRDRSTGADIRGGGPPRDWLRAGQRRAGREWPGAARGDAPGNGSAVPPRRRWDHVRPTIDKNPIPRAGGNQPGRPVEWMQPANLPGSRCATTAGVERRRRAPPDVCRRFRSDRQRCRSFRDRSLPRGKLSPARRRGSRRGDKDSRPSARALRLRRREDQRRKQRPQRRAMTSSDAGSATGPDLDAS